MSDIAEQLLGTIAAGVQRAEATRGDGLSSDDSWHTVGCGYRQREWGEPCECAVPAEILRRCAADRETLKRHARRPDGFCAKCVEDTYNPHDPFQREVYPCEELVGLARGYGLEVEQ